MFLKGTGSASLFFTSSQTASRMDTGQTVPVIESLVTSAEETHCKEFLGQQRLTLTAQR